MTNSNHEEDQPVQESQAGSGEGSVPPADRQITDEEPRREAEQADPDAGPTATAEQVERDSERDQAEGD